MSGNKPWLQIGKLTQFMNTAARISDERRREMDDIATEEAVADGLRNKKRAWSGKRKTSFLEIAAKAPGDIAKTILFLALWLAILVVTAPRYAGWGFREALSFIPFLGSGVVAYAMARLIWRAIGEGARDLLRNAVRFWPMTLVLLIVILGGLRLLLGGSVVAGH